MTLDDRHAAFCAGLETGLAMRCELDTAEAEHEAGHAAVRPVIKRLLADLNRRGPGDYAQLQDRLRARQIEACERFKADATPWTAEAGGPE